MNEDEISKVVENIIRDAYPGDVFPETRDAARAHSTGDTLADFVMLECLEVIEGEDNLSDAIAVAEHSMYRAVQDLEAVRGALISFEAGCTFGRSIAEALERKEKKGEQQRIIPEG